METLAPLEWLFDLLLSATLLLLAWMTLKGADLFKAIVMFIAFGLLMTLAWVRLDAPDVAMAEAAIGAGLTGALLLAAVTRLGNLGLALGAREEHADATGRFTGTRMFRRLLLALMVLLAAGAGYAVVSLPLSATGLQALTAAHIDSSGVSNPVTAVLLNFRGYDTLLETFVLLVAVLGSVSLQTPRFPEPVQPGLVLKNLTGLLLPLFILTAAYLLWVGAHAPGGAFQAGSVLGAAGVLMVLSGLRPSPGMMRVPMRLSVAAGPAMFIAAAAVLLFATGALLQYPADLAGGIIVLLESMATLSIAAMLALLYLGLHAEPKRDL